MFLRVIGDVAGQLCSERDGSFCQAASWGEIYFTQGRQRGEGLEGKVGLIVIMTGYTKLFGSLIGSSIWRREPDTTRIVWITMLALANQDGVVEASLPGLADFAKVSEEATRAALEAFLAPDPDSRSKEHEGRRIESVEGGWVILNHRKYRAKLGYEERREYLRVKQQEYRARIKALTPQSQKRTGVRKGPSGREQIAEGMRQRGDEEGAKRVEGAAGVEVE